MVLETESVGHFLYGVFSGKQQTLGIQQYIFADQVKRFLPLAFFTSLEKCFSEMNCRLA